MFCIQHKLTFLGCVNRMKTWKPLESLCYSIDLMSINHSKNFKLRQDIAKKLMIIIVIYDFSEWEYIRKELGTVNGTSQYCK